MLHWGLFFLFAVAKIDEMKNLKQSIIAFDNALERLRNVATEVGIPSPEHEDWYALLHHKLLPQIADSGFLIVAVMGGTNIGKSLLFNHLAGEQCSAVDPHAAGTKHPVCLVPNDEKVSEAVLRRQFDGFRIVAWTDQNQPLEPSDTSLLFWKKGQNVPNRLVLIDTPDIDSNVDINWERATLVRHAADVLIAVLTGQKYNDAIVRRFFRESVAAGKPVIVVFNMVDFHDEVLYLMRWLEQFSEGTSGTPLAVFAAPFDKKAAEQLSLPFFVVKPDSTLGNQVNLCNVLNELEFESIKKQTLLGAVSVLNHPDTGVPSYLRLVESTSQRFADALNALEHSGETAIDWPGLPATVLTNEIGKWWHAGRPGWSQNINDAYRTVGSTLAWPIRKISKLFSSQQSQDPLEEFRHAEEEATVRFIEKIIAKIRKLAETDNPVLRRELSQLITGEHRARLVEESHRILWSLEPVDQEFRSTLHSRLADWTAKNPTAIQWLRSADHLATIARPVITVSLAIFGWGVGVQVVGQIIGDAAIAGGITASGEAALYVGTEGVKQSTARLFRQIQEDFVVSRSRRFYATFQKELWKDLLPRLWEGANLTESEAFQACADAAKALKDSEGG